MLYNENSALRKHDVCLLMAIRPKMSLEEDFNTSQNFAEQVRTVWGENLVNWHLNNYYLSEILCLDFINGAKKAINLKVHLWVIF